MQFFLHVVSLTALSIPSILGYNLVFGKAKIFHFGPLTSSLVAAYGTFVPLSMFGYGWLPSLCIGAALTAVTALLFAWLSLRLEPDGFGVLSLAAHLAMLAVALNWTSLTRGALGIPRIPRMEILATPGRFALVSAIVAALWVVALVILDRSALGRRLAALSEHSWHAQSVGISRRNAHIVVFLIAGLGALITNALYPQLVYLLHPSDFGFPFFIFFVMIIVAGKPGSVLGCTLATILLTALREGIRFLPLAPGLVGPVRLAVFGVILLAAVWWRRDVLFPKQRSV